MDSLSHFASLPGGRTALPVFGVVIDATRVYCKPQNMKFAATARIVDQSWCLSAHPSGFAPCVKVIFMAEKRNAVPHIEQLGAIIKFEGGLLRVIEEDSCKTMAFLWDKKSEKGNWSIVNTHDCLSELQLKESELNRVKQLQSFAKEYFQHQTLMKLTQNLSKARADNEVFNVIVQVIKVKQSKKHAETFALIKVLDHTDKAYLAIPEAEKEEFAYLRAKDFVLLRNVRYTDLVNRYVELEENGNALVLPECLQLLTEYRELIDCFADGATMKTAIEEKKLITPTDTSIVKNEKLPFTSLKKVTGADGKFGVKYRVKVYVIEMGPEDVKEWVKGYCEKCKKFFGLTAEDEVAVCRTCKEAAKMAYQVQLFVKDKELRDNPEVYRLLLWTHNGKGKDFFDEEKPMNCYRSEWLCNKLEEMYSRLTRYNVYLDCIVERMSRGISSFVQITDTIVKC